MIYCFQFHVSNHQVNKPIHLKIHLPMPSNILRFQAVLMTDFFFTVDRDLLRFRMVVLLPYYLPVFFRRLKESS